MLEERVRIVNYAEVDEQVEVTLELAADAADIFEVRGWTRVERGLQLPIATRRDRVTFRYDGLDGRRTTTHVAFGEPRRHRGGGRTGRGGVRQRRAGSGSPGTGRSPRATRASCAG